MHIGSQFQVEVTLQMFSEEGILFDTFIRPQGYRKGFFGGWVTVIVISFIICNFLIICN